ncbi:hypothetical protein TA3x_001787 [Tundrisphaera sp. TA3]|uniref:hypothetical protein n=1 Tax=Tundrisphaera sp. TA3 TaxID=3435775 RepID=UPI003EBFAF3B
MDHRSGDMGETRRGIDPMWWECGGLSYGNLLVRAPCSQVVAKLRGYRDAPTHVGDLLAEDGMMIGPVRDDPVVVYQLRGHEWTQIHDYIMVSSCELASDLSRRLGTRTYEYGWEDVASALFYQIFDEGELIEVYSMCHNLPIYEGAVGEADLARKQRDGWRISRDHTFEFFTRRGTELDVESPKECDALPERVAANLGMFVACMPFWHCRETGRIVRAGGWDRGKFEAAYVLWTPKS